MNSYLDDIAAVRRQFPEPVTWGWTIDLIAARCWERATCPHVGTIQCLRCEAAVRDEQTAHAAEVRH